MLMIKNNLFRVLVICIFVAALLAAYATFVHYGPSPAGTSEKPAPPALAQRDKLVIITRSDLHGYYSYEDQPQGFEYELAKAFAEYAGLDLQMIAGGSWEDIKTALLTGPADVIAGMVVSSPNSEKFALSNSYLTARQVSVTNKKQAPINEPADLAGRDISVAVDSIHQASLDELMAQGIGFNATYYSEKTTDDFVKGVAEGAYDVTMAFDYIAMTYTRHYPNINIGMVIKDDLQLAWAVRPNDTELLAKVNEFFAEMQADGSLERLYDRYFGINHEQSYNELESFHRKIKRSLPGYQNVIRQSAYQHGFDWRLIAAIIYQESQFNPNAVSYYGASGLMQLMPKTAASMGLPAANIYDPHKNINAGVKYLKRMYDLFDSIPDDTERMRLALASYNAGIGHVLDARKLAEDQGLDKDQWENIGPMLKLLTQREYYSKAKYGYCNGNETNNYVNNVMTYYDILKYQDTTFNVDFELEENLGFDFQAQTSSPPTKIWHPQTLLSRWLN